MTDKPTTTFDLLREIVKEARCKPGWRFAFHDEDGVETLHIIVSGQDSWDEAKPRTVAHLFLIPRATYGRRAWQRWIFECCRSVENHELGEWLRFGAARPFLPLHGPGEIPYVVVEYRDEIDARTTQDGTVREEGPRPTVPAADR